MTLAIRDCSDFDADPINLAGLSGLTHKATEGTSIVHQKYGPRLNAWRGQVPVLGSYHVVRTPGSGGAGSLANQLQFWVSRMDSQTPWWRDYPWILQIDAERWSYDNVAASTVTSFADLVAKSGLPGWKVTYASRTQYGDSLTGIPTALWNADYRGNGVYLGDAWVAGDKGQPEGWAPFSGRVPALLQWNGGPDLNAFRGSLEQLIALTQGDPMAFLDDPNAAALAYRMDALQAGADKVQGGPEAGESMWLVGAVKDLQSKVAAMATPTPPTQDQVNTAVAAVMNDPAWLAQMGAAVASHIHVA